MKRVLPLLMLLAACAPPAPPQPGAASGAAADRDAYREAYRAAAAAGSAVYQVDPDASLVAVVVRRAGLAARLGHDHVVASRSLEGYAAPGLGRADIAFRVDRMSIDEAGLLREAGIDTQPSAEAVEGTRRNMLGPVLEAARYPTVTLHAELTPGRQLRAAVTLHGFTRWMTLPGTLEVEAARLDTSGTVRLKQTDFGITPFSVGGGLLAVQDELEVRYHIVARRWAPSGHRVQ